MRLPLKLASLVGAIGLGLFAAQSLTTQSTAAVTTGKAPEFTGLTTWVNSAPQSLGKLRGKVVLVHFWTYGCINCVHTLPHITALYDKYKSQGLVVVGIHAPEFPYEREIGNVRTAIKRHNIHYPVAQDNAFATWNAYGNQYWPAAYIIDKNGQIVFHHHGEGAYAEMERIVRQLLQANS